MRALYALQRGQVKTLPVFSFYHRVQSDSGEEQVSHSGDARDTSPGKNDN